MTHDEARSMPYGAYLLTPEWRRTRDRALVRASWTCQRCSSKRFLQVHHRTYERLGAELAGDLEVVCADCHEGEHLRQMEASDSRVYLAFSRETLRANPFGSIGDLSEQVKQLCAKRHVRYDGPEIHRAIGLVTGTRIVRPARRSIVGWQAEPRAITAQDAHEVLRRLLQDVPVDRLIKTMPAIAIQQSAATRHTELVMNQALDMRRTIARAQCRPRLRERLEAIFATRSESERSRDDLVIERLSNRTPVMPGDLE